MTTNSGIRAIVAGHGQFAPGLISAVEQITGLGAQFYPISNSGLGAADIEAMVRAAVAETGAKVVFTDLPAGSCTMAVRRMAKLGTDVTLVTGVTLPILLAFATGSTVEEAVARGRESIVITGESRGD